MSDPLSMSTDSALFQLRQSGMNRTLSTTSSHKRESGDSNEELKKASDQFESLLLNMMIREMRATVPESTLFPQTMAQEIYTGMLDEKFAETMAENGGVGLSRMIFNQLQGK